MRRILTSILATGLAFAPLHAETSESEARLVKELSASSAETRRRAADMLAEFGELSPAGLAAARERARDSDPEVRALSALALKWDEPSRDDGRQILTAMLSSASRAERVHAAEALCRFDESCSEALPALLEALSAKGPERGRALRALSWHYRGEAEGVSKLLGLLSSSNAEEQRLAAIALGNSRSKDVRIFAALKAQLSSSDPALRVFAARGLAHVPSMAPTLEPILLEGLKVPEARSLAAQGLARLRVQMDKAAAVMTDDLETRAPSDVQLARQVLRAIPSCGKLAAGALPALERLRKHWSQGVRAAAAEAATLIERASGK